MHHDDGCITLIQGDTDTAWIWGFRDGESDSKPDLAAKALAVEEQNVPGAVDINKRAEE